MNRFITLFLLAAILCILAPDMCRSHEVRPSYLELNEIGAGEFSVTWKTPMRGEMRLALDPAFSVESENLSPVVSRMTGTASIQTWRMRFEEPLRGSTVTITGLKGTMTDTLVRITFADGTTWVHRLTAQDPSGEIPHEATALGVANVYLKLGIEHILLGIDHLLFVLALLIITLRSAGGTWRLVKTITAFTIAHSITLGLASLGFVSVPGAPVEAIIALSILFLASEIVHKRNGVIGITERYPWVIAFIFGLFHGLGFAGALSEIGVPQHEVPLALFTFNVGVETGQLLFVGVVLGLMALLKRLPLPPPAGAWRVAPYCIGSLAAFWTIQRVMSFVPQ